VKLNICEGNVEVEEVIEVVTVLEMD